MFQLSSTSLTASPYGAECNPDKAPEAISKAVASLPPEQMFELMKQMKHCIQNNPNEARNMLLQNPQLAYALLQAQVLMNIVEPQVALTMLHRPNEALQPLMPAAVVDPASDAQIPLKTPLSTIINSIPSLPDTAFKGPNVANLPVVGLRPPVPIRPDQFLRGPANYGFVDPRSQQFEPRGPRNMNFDAHMRPPMMRAPMMMPPMRGEPVREMNRGDPRALPHDMDIRPPHFDSRLRGMDPRGLRGPPPPEFDPRGMGLVPIRSRFPDRGNFESGSPIYDQRDPRNQPMRPPRPGLANPPPALQIPGQGPDQEKAALIMQVLQLSDQQIALLPPEQRQSIMVLKEQIAKSAEHQK